MCVVGLTFNLPNNNNKKYIKRYGKVDEKIRQEHALKEISDESRIKMCRVNNAILGLRMKNMGITPEGKKIHFPSSCLSYS
jgi:hypothetical protein